MNESSRKSARSDERVVACSRFALFSRLLSDRGHCIDDDDRQTRTDNPNRWQTDVQTTNDVRSAVHTYIK
jgi:hypothetical protein